MIKVLGEFKRTSREDFRDDWFKVLIWYLLLWVILLINELWLGISILNVIKERLIITNNIEIILWVVIFLVLNVFMPPDFQYSIIEDAESIYFKFADGKQMVISKSFIISKKTIYNLLLKDNENGKVIDIPYNKEVLKVLKEIQN